MPVTSSPTIVSLLQQKEAHISARPVSFLFPQGTPENPLHFLPFLPTPYLIVAGVIIGYFLPWKRLLLCGGPHVLLPLTAHLSLHEDVEGDFYPQHVK